MRFKEKIEELKDLSDSTLESRCQIHLPTSVETVFMDSHLMRWKKSGLRVIFVKLKVYEVSKNESLANLDEDEIDL